MNNELIKKIQQCPNLPSLPAIAVQVLELAAKPDVDIAEIARVISKDPALSGKILRTVNSSFYGRSQHVGTISHALVILGLQSVKTLVLGFSLVTTLSKNKTGGFNHLKYWRRSIFAATAARTLAIRTKLVQQEEVFLAALLQDIGMLVLNQVINTQYSELSGKTKTHAELIQAEQGALQLTHAEVGAFLAQQWKLPPILSTPVGASHNADGITDPTLKKIAQAVQIAGYCADVYVDAEAAPAIVQVRASCAAAYNMTEADCDQLLQEIGLKTKEVIPLFEMNIGGVTNYEAILKKANEALVDLTLESQMQNTKLQQQNQALQQKASTDGLTGLSNRASFDEFFSDKFRASKTANRPITLLMMDVDRFKAVNDKHGHQAGDLVISNVAKIIRAAARPQDLAARYGGEEMALILPDTPRQVAAAIAEAIRLAIAKQPVHYAGHAIPVTISIGVATLEPGCAFTEPGHLLKAADMAVYAAKRAGRNCVKIFSMPTPASGKPGTAAA